MSRLYNLRCIQAKHTSKEQLLKGFPASDRGGGSDALVDLIRRNMVLVKRTSYGDQVSLNKTSIKDIQNILNPVQHISDKPPVEESLDNRYDKKPFHVTFGDKIVRGIRAKYSFHRNLSDSSRIIVYIIVDGEKKSTFELGSFRTKNSFLYKTTVRIDEKFGQRPFTKPDLYTLGKDIEGNRQLPKAILDILIYEGYAIQKSKRHYQRTMKKLPTMSLESFQKSHDKTNVINTN